MIRHEAVPQQRKTVKLRVLLQQVEIGDAIRIAREDDLSRIAALRNVVRNIGDHDTRQSSHSKNLTEKILRRTMDCWFLTLWFPHWEEITGVRPVCPQVKG